MERSVTSDGGRLRPTFIMGHHRSGTTILYSLLAKTGLFNVTTLFHVVNRQRLRMLHETGKEQEARRDLAAALQARGLANRKFDSVPISVDMPEEYAYALEEQGRRPQLSPATREGFLRFCRGCHAVAAARTTTVVEESVRRRELSLHS